MIISSISYQGGEGRTTNTINLGGTLVEMGKSVLIIGLSSQENLSTGLGLKKITNTLFDVLTNESDLFDAIYNNIKLNGDNWQGSIDVLPGNSRLPYVRYMNPLLNRNLLFKKLFQEYNVTDKYDCILFDCPRSDWILINNALAVSNLVLFLINSPLLPEKKSYTKN